MNNTQKTERRSRYKRAEKNNRFPGIYQHPGDTEILKLVNDYKIITRPLLELLTGRKDKPIKRRLRFLFDHEYLDKLYFSKTYVAQGSLPDIYVLDKKGRGEYRKRTGNKASRSQIRNQNKDPQLEHTLLINTVRAIITATCNSRDDVELESWECEGKEARDSVKLADGKKWPIAPDAFFVIRSNGVARAYFLEADRSSMDRNRMKKKYQAYFIYWKSIHAEVRRQKRQKLHPIKLSDKFKFAVPGFAVLTVIEDRKQFDSMKEDERLNGLLQTALKVGESGNGWGGLFFTCKSRLNIKKPEEILTKPIWQVGYQKGDKSIEDFHTLI